MLQSSSIGELLDTQSLPIRCGLLHRVRNKKAFMEYIQNGGVTNLFQNNGQRFPETGNAR